MHNGRSGRVTRACAGLGLLMLAALGCTRLVATSVPPTAQPSPTPGPDTPRLDSALVLALVADRLRGAGLAVDVQRTGRATYLGHGQWRVVYRAGEWLVQESDYGVVTANDQARNLEAAPSPGR